MSEIIEHRRNCARRIIDGPAHCSCDYTERYYEAMVSRLTKNLEEARARVAKLEARLEIDHVWVSQGDGPLERDEQIDGIECRDETIKLARARIKEVGEEARRKAIEECLAKVAAAEELPGLPPERFWEEVESDPLGTCRAIVRATKTEITESILQLLSKGGI